MASPLPRWTPAFYQRALGILTALCSVLVGTLFIGLHLASDWNLMVGAGMIYFVVSGLSTWVDGRIAGRAEARALQAPKINALEG